MASLDTVVTIVITKDTATLSRVGFGLPAMLTYNTAQTELAKLYGNIDEMLSPAGPFVATSREIAIATAIFSQNPRPTGVVVLRRATAPLRDVIFTPVTDVTAGKPFANFAYSIKLGDGVNIPETFTFTTDVTPTVAEITAGLVALINAGTIDVLATDGTTDFTVESADAPGGSATAGIPFTAEVDRSLITQAETTPDPGIVADLAAARQVNDDWYALVTDATSAAEIAALATNIGTLKRVYIAESADDDVIGPGSGDIASTLQTAAHERTALFSHPKPHTSPAGAWVGVVLPNIPGSLTWKFKTLTGIDTISYDTAEGAQLDGKNANYYTLIAGLQITTEGVVSSGEFLDTVRGIDQTSQLMQENVFRVLKVNPKISYTDAGIQIIVNEVEGVLDQKVSDDFLASDPAFTVDFPRARDVDKNTKALRTLPDITFSAFFASAVHKVELRGRLSV